MYSANFDYHRAKTLSDAQRLLAANPGAKLLAGGHSLIPLMKLRLASPSAVVDIGRIPELRGISRSGDSVRIGSLTTHAEIAASSDVQKAAPALAEAAALIGDPAVRSRGTIGGNIAHADPASDLPTVLVALDARIVAIGPSGERTIAADGFFTGIMSTALADNEVVTAILVPAAARGQGSAYVKFPHPASRYAVIGVAASVTMTKNECSAARVALGGLLPHASRAGAVEKALTGKSLDTAAIANAAAQVASDIGKDVTGDIFASAGYRAAVAPIYVKRAIAAAAARAGLA
ncbi:MAG TPA: xanthine dehydrogenase family protein subunit M [Vicinamibacterales bacterium]|jgi:aerobic carbon-monoxide dehydrogenase medium subunit|nr:xanthine dehydrogenase family protein subunit M [Vicinamibacterales bacterium]